MKRPQHDKSTLNKTWHEQPQDDKSALNTTYAPCAGRDSDKTTKKTLIFKFSLDAYKLIEIYRIREIFSRKWETGATADIKSKKTLVF